jgi:hypothetical protein
LSLRALDAAFVDSLITMWRFRSSAPKDQNGFVERRNCFVARPSDEIIAGDTNNFIDLWDNSKVLRELGE